jgi:hypothetical protein
MTCEQQEWGPVNSRDDKPVLVTHLEVVKCTTDVDDRLFTFDFPAGALVSDLVRTEKLGWDPEERVVQYVIPADAALLDEAIEQAVKGAPAERSLTRIVYSIVALSVMGAIVFVIYLRSRRRAASPPST